MPRPRKRRCCRRYSADRVYKPQGVPMRQIDTVTIRLDEFEAMRLCDVEGLDQSEAGQRLGVSRGTVQRLLYTGRRSLIGAILTDSAVVINLRPDEANHVGMHSEQQRHGAGSADS